MSGIAVTKVILDQPEIIASIRECEATGVSQHVRMNRRQAGTLRCSRGQVIDVTSERLAALRYEKPGKAVCTRCQIALNRAKFITRDRLFDGESVLEAPNPEASLIEVERKSLCIDSQLKSPSSSEVASMIEGVVHHCTEMEFTKG